MYYIKNMTWNNLSCNYNFVHPAITWLCLPPLGQNVPVARFEWHLAVLGTAAIGKVSAKLTDEG